MYTCEAFLMCITLLAHTVSYAIALLSLPLLLHSNNKNTKVYKKRHMLLQCTVILPHSRHCVAARLNVAKL